MANREKSQQTHGGEGGDMADGNLGKFRLSTRLVYGQPEMVTEIFRLIKCVMVRAEMLLYRREIEYTALCIQPEEIKDAYMKEI